MTKEAATSKNQRIWVATAMLTSLRFTAYNEIQSCGCSSGVEHLLPKQRVVGPNPITRSSFENRGFPEGETPFLRQGKEPKFIIFRGSLTLCLVVITEGSPTNHMVVTHF
jgi:hypothetical protein